MVQNRKCFSCQTSYSYCPNCSGADRFAPSWRAEFCSETCKDLWVTLTKFGMSMLTKSEAKSIISELDLKPIDTYAQCVQRDYAKVMTVDKKPKRGKRVDIQPIDEKADIQTEIIESVIEKNIEIKTEQPIEVVEQLVTEPEHEVVKQENE